MTAVWSVWTDIDRFPAWDPREQHNRLDGPFAWRAAGEARLGETTYPQFNILSAINLVANRNGSPPTRPLCAIAERRAPPS